MTVYFLQPIVLWCLLAWYPAMGAPTSTVDPNDIRQAEKFSSEIATGCSQYLSSIESLVNSSSNPARNCFAPVRPCESSEDVFQLISQDLNSSQTFYDYSTAVINADCSPLTPENEVRCIFLIVNIVEPLKNLIPVLHNLLPSTNKQEYESERTDKESPDSSVWNSGWGTEELLESNGEDPCWNLDYAQQKSNYQQLQGLTVLIQCDLKRLEDAITNNN